MTDTALSAGTLTEAERALVDTIAARREEIVALACELICFDTTSRSDPDMPPRQEAGFQALPTGTRSLMFNGHIDWAHTVDEYVPIDDLVSCAQTLAVAASRRCR